MYAQTSLLCTAPGSLGLNHMLLMHRSTSMSRGGANLCWHKHGSVIIITTISRHTLAICSDCVAHANLEAGALQMMLADVQVGNVRAAQCCGKALPCLPAHCVLACRHHVVTVAPCA